MTSATELIGRWMARDRAYARRKIGGVYAPLSDNERTAVADWRLAEVDQLPVDDRGTAYQLLQSWQPPVVKTR